MGKQRWMGAAPAGGMAGAVLQCFDTRSRERSLRRDAVTLPDCTHTQFLPVALSYKNRLRGPYSSTAALLFHSFVLVLKILVYESLGVALCSVGSSARLRRSLVSPGEPRDSELTYELRELLW